MNSQFFQSDRIGCTSRKNRRSPALRAAALSTVETLESRTLLSTTISPIADTFVRNNDYSLTNFGNSPLLFVKNASSGDTRIAYLKFDVSSFGSIPSATLQLSGSLLNSLSTPVTTAIYGVSDTTWIEGSGNIVDSVGDGFDTSSGPPGSMTFNNAPAVTPGPIATANITRDSYQTYSFDISSYVQQQLVAGASTISLAIENIQPSAQEISFLSRESNTAQGAGPQLTIGDANPANPTATVSAPDVTSASGTEAITVTYAGGAAIDPTTINASNLSVTSVSGGGALNVESNVGVTQNLDGSITAVYTVDAPGGTWTAPSNGAYAIDVVPGFAGVSDINGLGAMPGYGSFRVSVGDSTAPTAQVSAQGVTSAGGGTYTFSVVYNDDVAVDASTITLANVGVSGPVGPLKITGLSINPGGNAAQVVATYTAVAPNGAWSAADNGIYTVSVHSGQVFDIAGNPNGAASGTFNVAISVPDTTPPTANITAPDVTSPGGATETVTVVFNDNAGIQTSTITVSDLVVTAPNGSPLQVTGVNVSGGGQHVTAAFTVAAPNGAWDATDNGTYAIAIAAGLVTDTSGNPLAATSGAFNVSAALADTQPPAVAISAPAVTSAGANSEAITVVYKDNVGIALNSIGTGNISVSGPGGPLTVTGFSTTGSGTQVTATYIVQAPNGSWDASDDGTYSIALNSNQVLDTSNNAAPVTFGSFAVNIPIPNPTDSSFSGGGAVTSGFVAEATITLQDGRIVLVGHQQTQSGSNQGVVECLTATGTIDTTFGNQGMVITPAGNAEWFGVTVQGANHFIVAGTDNGDFALTRYDFAGNVDPTFGTNGVALTDFGSANDVAYSLALSPTGQVVAGGTSNNRFAFARYDANGKIDGSFGEDGRQLFDTGQATQAIGAIAVQNDGRVVVAGSSGTQIDVVRLTTSGEPDTDFHSTGLMAVPGLEASSAGDYTIGLGLQGDGDIVVASQTTSGHFGVARLKGDGTIDSAFGTSGLATANFGGQDEADAVVIQSNGDILVIGTSLKSSQPFTAVAAFDPTGKLIQSFGENGLATFAAPSSTQRELHIGDLVLRAFGGPTSGGKLLVGASSSGGAHTVSSSLRRILVPGTTSDPGISEILLGVFGVVNKKHTRLSVDLGSGRKAIFTLSSGTATALQAGNDIHLEITNGGSLNVTVQGGGTFSFSNIDITGALKSLHAPAGILNGTLSASSSIGHLTLGSIPGKVIATGSIQILTSGDITGEVYSGASIGHAKVGSVSGLIDAAVSIGTLNALSLDAATILAGASFPAGTIDLSGSTGTFAGGTITSVHVAGGITASFVGAGVNPTDGTFGDGNDTSAGTGLISKIFAKNGADSASHFESSAFGTAKLPKKIIDLTTDPRFIIV